jgi:hypothetical protein
MSKIVFHVHPVQSLRILVLKLPLHLNTCLTELEMQPTIHFQKAGFYFNIFFFNSDTKSCFRVSNVFTNYFYHHNFTQSFSLFRLPRFLVLRAALNTLSRIVPRSHLPTQVYYYLIKD